MSNYLDPGSSFKFNFLLSEGVADESEIFKFDLFLMTREMRQLTQYLRRITLWPQDHRRRWVKDNQEMLNQFMQDLTFDIFDTMEEAGLDQSVLAETIICVTELRELANTLHSVLRGGKNFIVDQLHSWLKDLLCSKAKA